MPNIITVSREFGSGGRELAIKLAEELNIPCYNQEIIQLIVEKTGINPSIVEDILEKKSEIFSFKMASSFTREAFSIQQTEVLTCQEQVLKDLAMKEDCVILGHGCTEILAEYKPFSLFVFADKAKKIERCRKKLENENLSDREIWRRIREIDKGRKKAHDQVAKTKWGDRKIYSLCINTSNVEIDAIAKPIAEYAKAYFKRRGE